MENNNELNEIHIKITRHYFNDIININDSDLDNVLVDIINHTFGVAYKTLSGAKPLHAIFVKAETYIRKQDETKI